MIAASMRRGGLRASLWPGKLVFVFLLKSEMDQRNHTYLSRNLRCGDPRYGRCFQHNLSSWTASMGAKDHDTKLQCA